MPFLMPSQQLGRGGWCTGPRVQHGNVHFPAREGLIENGKIANHQGEQAKTDAGLDHGYRPRGGTGRSYVAKTESEEGRAAIVEVREEAGVPGGHAHVGSKGEVQQGKTE